MSSLRLGGGHRKTIPRPAGGATDFITASAGGAAGAEGAAELIGERAGAGAGEATLVGTAGLTWVV